MKMMKICHQTAAKIQQIYVSRQKMVMITMMGQLFATEKDAAKYSRSYLN
jgi:hypothetical protein